MKPVFRTKSDCSNKITIKSRDKRPSNIAAVGRYLMETPWPDLMTSTHSSSKKLSILTELINYGLITIRPERSIKISESRSSGPDDLPDWVLKEFAYVLAPPITDIAT